MKQNSASSSLDLNISQELPVTGGTLSAYSSLSRIDNFNTIYTSSYSSNPISLSYTQNLTFDGGYFIDKKIQSLTLEATSKKTIETLEDISVNVVDLYFTLLKAQSDYNNTLNDKKNAEKLYQNAEIAYKIGKTAEIDYLNDKLNYYNLQDQTEQKLLAFHAANNNLTEYLGLPFDFFVTASTPEKFNFFNIDFEEALDKATQNKNLTPNEQIQILNNRKSLLSIKSKNGLSLSLSSGLGYSKYGTGFKEAYTNLNNQMSFSISLNIPLVDWGANRIAKEKLQEKILTDSLTSNKEKQDLKNDLFQIVTAWNQLKNHLNVTKLQLGLALRRYQLAFGEYSIGKINFEQYTRAQIDKNKIDMMYLDDVKSYWEAYYKIRELTLYNFKNQENLKLFF